MYNTTKESPQFCCDRKMGLLKHVVPYLAVLSIGLAAAVFTTASRSAVRRSSRPRVQFSFPVTASCSDAFKTGVALACDEELYLIGFDSVLTRSWSFDERVRTIAKRDDESMLVTAGPLLYCVRGPLVECLGAANAPYSTFTASGENRVLIGTQFGKGGILVLTHDGKVQSELTSHHASHAAISDSSNMACSGGYSGDVFLHAVDGNETWKLMRSAGIVQFVSAMQGRFYVFTRSGVFYSIEHERERRWIRIHKFKLDAALVTTFTRISDEIVCCTDAQRHLIVINVKKMVASRFDLHYNGPMQKIIRVSDTSIGICSAVGGALDFYDIDA